MDSKYMKYKLKYLQIKQHGGTESLEEIKKKINASEELIKKYDASISELTTIQKSVKEEMANKEINIDLIELKEKRDNENILLLQYKITCRNIEHNNTETKSTTPPVTEPEKKTSVETTQTEPEKKTSDETTQTEPEKKTSVETAQTVETK